MSSGLRPFIALFDSAPPKNSSVRATSAKTAPSTHEVRQPASHFKDRDQPREADCAQAKASSTAANFMACQPQY